MKDMGRKFNTTPGGIHIYIFTTPPIFHHPPARSNSPVTFSRLYTYMYIYFFFFYHFFLFLRLLYLPVYFIFVKSIYIYAKNVVLGRAQYSNLKYTRCSLALFYLYTNDLYKFVQIYISILLFALRRINHGKKICIIASTNGHQEP